MSSYCYIVVPHEHETHPLRGRLYVRGKAVGQPVEHANEKSVQTYVNGMQEGMFIAYEHHQYPMIDICYWS